MRPPLQEQAGTKRGLPFFRNVRIRWKLAAAAAALLALGAMLAGWSIHNEDLRRREKLLDQARRMTQTLPLDRIKAFHGSRADEQKPEYRRLKNQLMAARQIDPDWESLYLMGRRSNGDVYFQVDSEAFASRDLSRPGQRDAQASAILRRVFETRRAATEGPRPGGRVRAFVPLIDAKTDRVATVVGIDVAARRWRAQILRAGLVPALATFVLLVLLLVGWRLEQKRNQPEATARRPGRYLEAALTVCAGLTITLTAAWAAQRVETQRGREAFTALAQIKSVRVLDAFLRLRHLELEGLARFIESSEEVTLQEFRHYAQHLLHVPEVVAWAWIPCVEAARKPSFEQAVREAGWQGTAYRIWEADAAGRPIPAAERPNYCPIHYVESTEALSKYGLAPGRDLAAIDAIRLALEEADGNGLVCATDVLPPLPGAPSPQPLFFVFRPVRKTDAQGMPQGFVVAVVDPQAFLRSFLGESLVENRQVAMDLLRLRPGEAPRRIASFGVPDSPAKLPANLADPWTLARPIIAFGKTYAVAVRPSRTFVALHTYHLFWMVLLAGLSITLAGAVVINHNVHRREDLARMLAEQTRTLAGISQRFGLLAKQNRIAAWQIDAAGVYTEISDIFEGLSGYSAQELVGQRHFYDLCPEARREEFKAATFALMAKGDPIRELVHPIVAPSGQTIWTLTSGIPLRDAQGRVTGYWGTSTDVTERKTNEERMARLLRDNQVAANRYTALVKASNTGAWEYDHSTRRIWCSPEYFTLLGYDPGEFDLPPEKRTIDALWLALIHPGDREPAQRYLAAYLQSPRQPYDHRFRMRRKDGSWAWIWSRGQMLFAPDGQPTPIMVGTHIDVTERMRAEEALRESERKYRMLTESMKDVVWIVDAETLRFLYVSPSVEALRGYAPDEILAGTLADSLVPGQIEHLKQMLLKHAAEFRRGEITSRTFFTFELRQPRKNGTPIITEAVVRFWQNEQTDQLELHGVTRDVTERKRAEEDYRTLFQNMLEGFALHEIVCGENGEPIDYRFLAVNPAFERMTGLKAADILGKTAREVLPDLEPQWIETYGNVVRTGLPTFFENTTAPLGRRFEVTAFRSAPGQFACIFSDVTERHLALNELRESRRRYVALVENLPGMAYRCKNDRDWTMEFVSNGVLELTGYAPEDLIDNQALSFNDLVLPPYRDRLWGRWQTVLRDHGRLEAEYEIVARDGTIKWVWEQGEGVYDEQGDVVALEGFISDVSGRKLAEAERERLIRAIEQSGETILITDAAGAILYVNPAFTRTTGYSREEVLGQSPRLLQSGTHGKEFYREMWKVLETGQTWEGQIVNRRKDGAPFTEQVAISPVRDASGHLVNYVAVQRDITQQLRAEEEKDALQTQLAHAQKLESIGRLAGGVAHDFNNMLQAILGYVEIAIEQVPPDQPLHADLREIQKAAMRSTALTRQLQIFARKQVADPKVLDLNEAVEGMFGMLRRLIGEDIQLVWKPGRNVGLVKIDPSQLDQIVANLCINARDAIGSAGHVAIETSLEKIVPPAAGPALDLAPGTYARLSVQDDGAGMNPDVVEQIFEPFFTTKPTGKGTGLGLSTVYGAVKQNGGGIRVESQPGQGSTFKVYLPRHDLKDDPPPPPEAKPDDPIAARHETILLVEDEAVILRTTQRILESLGYQVFATDSPQDALRIAAERQGQIDLLLTDIIMSGMNGPELVRHLQETDPLIRYLFMSGYAANLLKEHGVEETNSNFIQKPFSKKVLAQKVSDALVRA